MINLKEIATIQSLVLPKDITDKGLEELKDCKSLTYLDLSFTKITDVGMAHIAALNELQTLYLSDTAISDASVANLKNMSKLHTLFLSGTSVTDACLTTIEQLPALGFIEMRDSRVSVKGVNALRANRPNLEIIGPDF